MADKPSFKTISVLGMTVRVDFYYTPAQRGRFYGPPELCYPDDPEELEIEAYTILENDGSFDWTEDDAEETFAQALEDALLQELAEEAADARECAAEERYEARRERFNSDW